MKLRSFVPVRPRRLVAPLLLPLLLLAPCLGGCRAGTPAGPGAASPPARSVGPKVERILEKLRDAREPEPERAAYRQRIVGKLISVKGTIRDVTDRIVMECPLEGRQETAFVAVSPDAANREALAILRPGQPLGALGVLTETNLTSPVLGTREAPLELVSARLKSR